jgi:hypothetical protein
MNHDPEAILNLFNQHLLSHGQPILNPSQSTVLTWCLRHSRSNYKDMAAASGYRASSLRDAGAKLFAIIETALGRSVKKTTCGQVVREWYEQKMASEYHNSFGREADVQNLLAAIQEGARRLICISGPPRMGKTHLVGRLCRQLQAQEAFGPLVSGHATTLPTVEALYQSVSTYLRERPDPGSLPAAAALTHLLETRKLLLVLEKTEVLHEPEAGGGRFKTESAGYESWLRSLLDRHSLRSCVILVCRVPPRCLQTSHDMLFHHPLRGLTASAAEGLLRQQGLDRYPTQILHDLAQFCGFNPGVLVAAAHKILTSGTRNPADFIRYPLATFHADDPIWQEALDDLTPSEYELLSWLLLHPDQPVLEDGHRLQFQDRGVRAWLPIMQSLRRRGLVEVDPSGAHFIHPAWLRHVVGQHGVERLAAAFDRGDIGMFNQYPLVVPQAPFWRRQWHRQYRLEPLGDCLAQTHPQAWTTQYRQDKMNAMLNRLRAQPEGQDGYGAGNLLNLAVALKVPLATLKVAGLTLRHADLWTAPLQGVDLTGCELIDSVLPTAMYGALTAALSPSGRHLAVGDETGRILCWRQVDGVFELYRFAQIAADGGQPLEITDLAFGDEDMLALVAGQTIYRWWLGVANQDPTPLMVALSPVTSLTCCSDEYVAAGLQDGGILVWDDSLEQQVELRRHIGRVQEVVVNPDPHSDQLLSRGGGDRILVWHIRQPEAEPQEIRPERHVFFRMAWQSGQPLTAAYVGDQLLLRMADGTISPLPYQGDISMLKFSPNGRYLAALKRDAVDIRSLSTLTVGTSIPHHGIVQSMAISQDGTGLLTVAQDRLHSPPTVRIWDVSTGQLSWELTASPPRVPGASLGLKLRDCRGLTEVECAYWQSYGVVV